MREWWTTQMWEEIHDHNGKERPKPRYEVGIDWERRNRYDNWMSEDRGRPIIEWIKSRDPQGFLNWNGSGFFYDPDVAMLFYLTFKKPA